MKIDAYRSSLSSFLLVMLLLPTGSADAADWVTRVWQNPFFGGGKIREQFRARWRPTVVPAAPVLEVREPAPAAIQEQVQRASRSFASNLFSVAAVHAGKDNVAVSPYSAASVLAMASLGATGDTEKEMRDTLFFPHTDATDAALRDSPHVAMSHVDYLLRKSSVGTLAKNDRGIMMKIANRIYAPPGPGGARTTSQGFETRARHFYISGVETMDFAASPDAARRKINADIATTTEQKIPELIPQNVLRSTTKAVLTNALFFRGCWEKPFDEDDTESELFRTAAGEVKETAMMKGSFFLPFHAPAGPLAGSKSEYKLLHMPYMNTAGGASEYGMVLLLPDGPDGFGGLTYIPDADEVEERIRLADARAAAAKAAYLAAETDRDKLRIRKSEIVDVSLPSFNVRMQLDLKAAFERLGTKKAFANPAGELAGIHPSKDFYFSDAFHEAVVEVGEVCTEAAAASAMVGVTRSGTWGPGPANPQFHARHPFVYIIRHRTTGTWLFVGRVTDPTVGKEPAPKKP